MDSDCTYDPLLLLPLLDAVTREGYDFATVSPYHPEGHVDGVPAYRLLLSKGISIIYRMLTFRKIYTFTALFRVYKKDVVKTTPIRSNNFIGVTELMLIPLLRGYEVKEIPATLHTRLYGVSKMKTARLGELAFLAFVVIAILAGLATFAIPADQLSIVTAVLVVLGVIVGLLNVSEKETTPFLVAAIALLVAGTASFGVLGGAGTVIENILNFIGAFVAPAAVIVAIKAVYALGAKK